MGTAGRKTNRKLEQLGIKSNRKRWSRGMHWFGIRSLNSSRSRRRRRRGI